MPYRVSFFEREIAADDPFEMAVIGAEQKRAIFAERFRPAAHLSIAGADDDFLAYRRAMFFPLIRDRSETSGSDPGIIALQLFQDNDGEFRAE